MIVITAPTSNIGNQIIARLAGSGKDVRAIVRDTAKLPPAIRNHVEIVEGSHSDPAVLERAYDGADTLFWLVPSATPAASAEAAYVDFARPTIEALKRSSISHVVSISALGRGWPKDAGHVSATLRMDDMIAATGVHYAALACSSLMSNIARQSRIIKTQGIFYHPTPPALKLPHVAPSDIADFSAKLLLDPDWSGFREIPMIGPEDLSFEEIADIVSDVLGKAVTFQQILMDDMKALVRQNGASEGLAQAMANMLTAKNEGMDKMRERTAQDRANTPTTFRQWCETILKPAVEA